MIDKLVFFGLIVPTLIHAGFFMDLLKDSGMEISCPSGNPIYINPVSADLQQCSQQLGVYNESTCPGGTVCERFPILVPEFQDYCCWKNRISPEDEITTETKPNSPDGVLPFSRRGAPDRGVVKGIVEGPKTFGSIEDEDEDTGAVTAGRRGSVRSTKAPTFPDEEDDFEWENESTKSTRRPRGRKVTPTTTQEPETTTKKSSSHRLPQCSNPDDSVFIDFGNRLRDCYFQQCGRGYRCEFNKYIRRFICCGKDASIVPPPEAVCTFAYFIYPVYAILRAWMSIGRNPYSRRRQKKHNKYI